MKVLSYSQTIDFDGIPVTYDLVPTQTVTSEHPFFDQILNAVMAGDFQYTLIERTEKVADYRHRY